MTAGELINNIAAKAGIATDDPKLKSLLATPELAAIQVDAELSGKLETGLISVAAAKDNHPEIRNKYYADFSDGMDKRLMKWITEDTLDAADLEEIKAEPQTAKKYELTITKLKAAKASAKGPEKEEIQKQINAAHEAARLAKAEVETVKKDYEGKIAKLQFNSAFRTVLSQYKTIHDELDPVVKISTMEALINKALQDKKATLVADEHGNLTLVGLDGNNVFGDNHVPLTPKSLMDKAFAPILKVSGPQKPASTNGHQPIIPGKVDEKAEAMVSDISSHNAKVIESLGSRVSLV